MANLRAGVIPYMSTGAKKHITRLASESIYIHANTWLREVTATMDKDGRLSISVKSNSSNPDTIINVELPANQGQKKDAFVPGISMSPEMEKEVFNALLIKYFGDDMAKSLLITRGIKGPLLEDHEDN